uniref:hypothetical protein n=1 Tax=Winogradskyella sp. TaxID=1883156 RepID=UPI003510EAAC
TCRGSRFADGAKRNPDGEVCMKNRETDEWLAQNKKSTKEFLRKWGHFCKHDALMKPIVPPKYDVGFVLKNTTPQLLEALEPWCSTLYTDGDYTAYQKQESLQTSFDLSDRIKPYDNDKNNEILVKIDGSTFSQQDFSLIQQLSEIIQDSGQPGNYKLGNLEILIQGMTEFQDKLIIL